MKKMLIVYYSWSNGNTERIAKELQEATGADSVRIETRFPYQGSYDDVVEQGQKEVDRKYEPEINPLCKAIVDYDVIAVGTPTWWYTMAPAVRTFLHQQNLKDKIVIPFMTHGGWPGHVIHDMKAACGEAVIQEPIEIQFDADGGNRLITSIIDIKAWIKRVKELL